jgi:3-oxoacyl-(acyl-carrier-protein) synthase
MNEKDAIVVTGIGVFSSIGCSRKSFWQSLVSGVSGVRKISTFNPDGHKSRIASEIQPFNPTDYISLKHSRKMATDLSVHHGVFTPAINYENKDPDCDIDIVANEARDQKLKSAISNSFGFGGQNAVLAFSKVN